MPLFNKYQTPNIYIPRTVLGAEDLVVKEIRKKQTKKKKVVFKEFNKQRANEQRK